MTKVVLLTALMLLPSAIGMATADRSEPAIRWVMKLYGLTNSGEAWLRAVCWQEGGRDGKRCGHLNPRMDKCVMNHPCIPKAARDEAKTARAFVRAMQVYLFDRSDWTTKDFSQFWAEYYHHGSKKENARYAKDVRSIYRQIRRMVEFRETTATCK